MNNIHICNNKLVIKSQKRGKWDHVICGTHPLQNTIHQVHISSTEEKNHDQMNYMFGDWGYLYPNNKAPYKIGFTQQTRIMKAYGYDLFPVQQLEFARLKLQKLKEFKRIYNNLKLLDTFKYTLKKKRLNSFPFWW